MLSLRRTCPGTWVDFNGHMRDAYYVLLISFANDQTMDELGMGPRYLAATGRTLYNLDTRIRYLQEAHGGNDLVVEMRLIDSDARRLHLHSLIRNTATDAILAINESVLMHVAQTGPEGRPAAEPFPPNVAVLVTARRARDGDVEKTLRVGGVGLGR
ncbi:MAG: thioesterase family protein [Pseudomonadota bacterium]